MPAQIILYSKEKCHLCEVAKKELKTVEEIFGISYKEIDIYKDDELLEKYSLMIPVVKYEGEMIQYGQVDFHTIQEFLRTKKQIT